jgi:hypothetical protein
LYVDAARLALASASAVAAHEVLVDEEGVVAADQATALAATRPVDAKAARLTAVDRRFRPARCSVIA